MKIKEEIEPGVYKINPALPEAITFASVDEALQTLAAVSAVYKDFLYYEPILDVIEIDDDLDFYGIQFKEYPKTYIITKHKAVAYEVLAYNGWVTLFAKGIE